jgi:hypothetical protein
MESLRVNPVVEGTDAHWSSGSGRRRPRIEGLATTSIPFDSNHSGYFITIPRASDAHSDGLALSVRPPIRRIVAGNATQHAEHQYG